MSKSTVEFKKNQRGAAIYSDTHADYVLPDYLGEVRKILFVGAEARPAGKYTADGSAEASGIVAYDVVYLDGEGKLSSAAFTSDYDVSIPLPGEGAEATNLATRVANFSVRLGGPRKISAKATVAVSAIASYTETVAPTGSAFSEEYEPELLMRDVNILTAAESQSVERELAETVCRLDGSIADEVSVIYSRADAECESVAVSDGEATVKGTLSVLAIIKNEDSEPYPVLHKIPFSESVAYPEASGGELFPSAVVTSLTTAVTPDESGCEVVANAIVDISLGTLGNESVTVTADAYLCECETENGYGELSYTELIAATKERVNHTAELSREAEGLRGLDEVLCLVGTARTDTVAADGRELTVTGTVKYTGAASCVEESGERSFMPLRLEVPFDERITLPSPVGEAAKIDVTVSVEHPTASLDAERIYPSSALDMTVVITEDKSMRILSSSEAREDLPFERRPATVTVYYPTEGDTLFSVAKHYHKSAARLAADNLLTEAVVKGDGESGGLSGVSKLIIH